MKHVISLSLVLLGVGLSAVKAAGAGEIKFTRVPGYGSTSSLRGQVYGVDAKKHDVAGYIYVYGWWTKP